MADEKDVTTETEEPGATIGADDNISETAEKETETDQTDEVDFEALMLEEGENPVKEEEPGEGKAKEEVEKEPAKDRASDILTTLKDLAAKLDGLPENQDANFNKMRQLNRTLVQKLSSEVEEMREATATISRFGEEKEIKEKLELVDDMNRYDVKLGYVNPDKAAEKIVQKDADHGYRFVMSLMAQPAGKGFLGDYVVKNALQLDLERLEEFQALSRGEIPEGYEGISRVSEKELEEIPEQHRETFKTLLPNQRALVKEGFGRSASQIEKLEAEAILRDRQARIDDDKRKVTEESEKQIAFERTVDEAINEGSAEAFETIGGVIERALGKIQFSGNAAQNATMQFGVHKALFGIENPMMRTASVNYFKSIGVPEKVIGEKIEASIKVLDAIDAENEVMAYTKARGQTAEYAAAKERFDQKVMNLARIGIGLAAQAARATGAAIKADKKTETKIPTNEIPNINRTSLEQTGQKRRYSAAEYAAAAAAGKVLR